jgi:hypothetical protein
VRSRTNSRNAETVTATEPSRALEAAANRRERNKALAVVDAKTVCDVRENLELPVDIVQRLVFIREETRFEIGLLHDRVNALISAEAFLTIAYTMAMSNASLRWGVLFSTLVAPILALVGLVLAALAWPGVDASYKIIFEWSSRQHQFMEEAPLMTELMWRLDVLGRGNRRADPDTRSTMLFARAVPAVFGVSWAILTVIAVVLPLRH